MKKIVYLYKDFEGVKSSGILKKISDQLTAWKQNGFTCKLLICTNNFPFHINDFPYLNPIDFELVATQNNANQFYKWVFNVLFSKNSKDEQVILNALKKENADIVYSRSSFNGTYLKHIRKLGAKHIKEFNGYQTGEYLLAYEETKSPKMLIKAYIDEHLNLYFSKYFDGFIFITDEIKNLTKARKKIAKTVIPNSIKTRGLENKAPIVNAKPTVVFAGTPNLTWQGIEKLMQLGSTVESDINFNIVGYTGSESELKAVPIPSNITFFGKVSQARCDEIINQSDMGMSALSCSVKKMTEACPLKIRNYLNFGLPVILFHKDTALDHKNLDWVLFIEENNIFAEQTRELLLQFANKYKGKRISETIISPLISGSHIEKKRIDFFNQVLNS